jgi:hypothetical protein
MDMTTVLAGLQWSFLHVFVPVLLPIISLWAASFLREYIKNKMGVSKLRSILEFGIVAVEATEQEYVKQVKLAAADGVVTKEEHEIAQSMAVNRLKSLVMAGLGINLANEDAKTVVEASLAAVTDAGRSLRQ